MQRTPYLRANAGTADAGRGAASTVVAIPSEKAAMRRMRIVHFSLRTVFRIIVIVVASWAQCANSLRLPPLLPRAINAIAGPAAKS